MRSGRARLAVLPFAPLTIAVIAHTSVQRAHREGSAPPRLAARSWLTILLDGRVRHEGDRVRITAHLIASQEETHVWAQTFDRVMTDALTVQTEVAEAIAKAVVGSIAPASEVP